MSIDPNSSLEHVSGGPPRLERLVQALDRVDLDHDRRDGRGAPTWLQAGNWRLLAHARGEAQPRGEEIESFRLASGGSVSAVVTPDSGVWIPFDLEEAYRNYVTEAWREHTSVRQLGRGQLKLYYRLKQLFPREFWLALRRIYIRGGKRPEFPAWPLEDGVDRLARFYALCLLLASTRHEAHFLWFWPQRYRAAVILTHDVESADGLRLALELADLEQERGLRSSFNVVGAQYEVDLGILRELAQRGFEIGLHGLRHDRSLFSSREEFERQLPGLAEAARRFEAKGFRSPATHRVIDWLGELPLAYDCTVPHSDPYEPQPGGCCSLWPYMLGGLVELPYTLPQDHTLFTLLGESSARTWLDQMDAIERRFGLIQCLSHPDRGYLGDADKRARYRDLLDMVAGREGLWKPLPRQVADWWRRRDAGETKPPEQLLGTIRRGSGPDYASFIPPPANDAADGAQTGRAPVGSNR